MFSTDRSSNRILLQQFYRWLGHLKALAISLQTGTVLVATLILIRIYASAEALECRSNCSLGPFRFAEPFETNHDECRQRVSATVCSVSIQVKYHEQVYSVEFGTNTVASDFIYVTSGPYLYYAVNYRCSRRTDCVIDYAKQRISELVARAYDPRAIHREIGPLMKSSSPKASIQCYDSEYEVVNCAENELCSLDFDQISDEVKSRGCAQENQARLSVFDAGNFASLSLECDRNLCNGDEVISQMKTILADFHLTDVDGRRIAAANERAAPLFTMAASLVFVAAAA